MPHSNRAQPCLLACPTFPHLPALLMWLAPMLLALFTLPCYSFSLQAVTESEVLKELLKLDPKNTSGSDALDPWFVKVAALIIATLISGLFNLSLLTGEVPIAWKAATVHPLFKGRAQADSNCYRQFQFCPVYQKCWKNLSIINWLAFLMSMVCNMVTAQVMDVSLQL